MSRASSPCSVRQTRQMQKSQGVGEWKGRGGTSALRNVKQ